MKPLGLAIIGLHHQHPRWYWPLWAHLPEYKPLAIAEADEAFGAQQNDALFHLDLYSDYRTMLQRDDIDVVILWLPHSQMPQAVADAAAAGKHVIVEKPCAADLAGARQIVATAKAHPRIKISAPYCWRTHPVSRQIVEAVHQGRLGQITAMEGRLNAGGAHRYIRDHAPWMLHHREGGGPMWNLGVHWIDYFRWLTGQEIVAVSGFATPPVGEPQRDIEDTAQAVLRFADGAVAMIEASYSLREAHPDKRDIYVSARGTLGDLAWKPAWEHTQNDLLLVSEHAAAGQEQARQIPVACRQIPGYCGEMAWQWLRDFAQAVRQDRPTMVSPEDILAAVRVADAFYRSLQSGAVEAV